MKKIVISILVIVLLLCLYIGFNKKLKVNNSEEYKIAALGDIGGGILLDGAEVNFSNAALASKNVEAAIDEIYDSYSDGCGAGYDKGTVTSGKYVCNKRTSAAAQTEVFQAEYVHYNNLLSELTSTNVHAAILELAAMLPNCKNGYIQANVTSSSYE